ncbi:MAG: hypothetical protein CMJ83_10300 [Planctomycetes bacterium]|nr:hypothetical protein [Planctomycetota bacterium]
MRTPTHIVVLPDGTEVDRLIDVHGTDSYLGLIAQGQKKLGGRGMSAAHYVKSQRLLRDARLAVQKQEVLASVTVLDELDKLVRGTPLAKEVKELRAKVDAIGHLALARSRELAAAGKPVEALRLLDDSIVAFESSPLRRDLKRARAKLASSKEGRVAARILKSENRARPSYDKAVVFEREKDYVNAVRAYYRVLGVAPGSPMADRARVRVDELRADKDLAAILGDVITDREADLLFKKGQRLRRQKKKADAQRVFAELVEKYPGSASAAKAKKLLGK